MPSCVNDPIGAPKPLLTASTPAIKVEVTAPMPGIRTPSRPLAGAMVMFGCFDNGKLLGNYDVVDVQRADNRYGTANGGTRARRSHALY